MSVLVCHTPRVLSFSNLTMAASAPQQLIEQQFRMQQLRTEREAAVLTSQVQRTAMENLTALITTLTEEKNRLEKALDHERVQHAGTLRRLQKKQQQRDDEDDDDQVVELLKREIETTQRLRGECKKLTAQNAEATARLRELETNLRYMQTRLVHPLQQALTAAKDIVAMAD
jgi:hypothetical protein